MGGCHRLNYIAQERYKEVLQNFRMCLIWKQSSQMLKAKMRSLSDRTGVLTERGKFGHRHRHSQKEGFVKRHRKNATSQWRTGMVLLHAKDCHRLPSKSLGARKGAWNRLSLTAQRRYQAWNPLDF